MPGHVQLLNTYISWRMINIEQSNFPPRNSGASPELFSNLGWCGFSDLGTKPVAFLPTAVSSLVLSVMVHTCSHLLFTLHSYDQLEQNSFNAILAWFPFENWMYWRILKVFAGMVWAFVCDGPGEPVHDLSSNQRWKDSRWITTCTSRVHGMIHPARMFSSNFRAWT